MSHGESPGPSWDDIADWYDELLRSGRSPHGLALQTLEELLPDVAGQRVLDIACGTGIVARRLAELGAQVTGTDFAPRMIERARAHDSAGPIEWVVDDAQRLAAFADDSFAAATCQLGLMDIPDLDATLSAIARVLRPGSPFVFVLGHPAFLVPFAEVGRTSDGTPTITVSRYLDERFWRSPNPVGVRRAGNYHRTLSTYLNGLVDAGFVLEAVAEPAASGAFAEHAPVYADQPIFFAARCRLAAPA